MTALGGKWTAAKLVDTCREWVETPCEYGCPLEEECKALGDEGADYAVCMAVKAIADKFGIKPRKNPRP